jgi:hypothetical protein
MPCPVRPLAFLLCGSALLSCACGPSLQDCAALAEQQPECMPQTAIDACEERNAACAEEPNGEVVVLESCPLQFACNRGPG